VTEPVGAADTPTPPHYLAGSGGTPSSSALGRDSARELVRYATLAASSHNSQPWKFALEADEICPT
jgi:nitroreductase